MLFRRKFTTKCAREQFISNLITESRVRTEKCLEIRGVEGRDPVCQQEQVCQSPLQTRTECYPPLQQLYPTPWQQLREHSNQHQPQTSPAFLSVLCALTMFCHPYCSVMQGILYAATAGQSSPAAPPVGDNWAGTLETWLWRRWQVL